MASYSPELRQFVEALADERDLGLGQELRRLVQRGNERERRHRERQSATNKLHPQFNERAG